MGTDGLDTDDLVAWIREQPLPETDRLILEACASVGLGQMGEWESPEQWLAQRVVRLLAYLYANGPGYRQEWAPGDG